MTVDPHHRRRDAASLAISLALHGLALFFIVVLAIAQSNSASESVSGDVITISQETRAPSEPPTIAPKPQPTSPPVTPRPVVAQPVVPPPVAVSVPIPTPVPDRPELSHSSVDAPPLPPVRPTLVPTAIPTLVPTIAPTVRPTAVPSVVAIVTPQPTRPPTAPPTLRPTVAPTLPPTIAPTVPPTIPPTIPPTVRPTIAPTVAPTIRPTVAPTIAPTVAPTVRPTVAPTVRPTIAPTVAPTQAPTAAPTARPTTAPTAAPTARPTTAPTTVPTALPTRVIAVATAAPIATASPGAPHPPVVGSPRPNAGTGSPGPRASATGAGSVAGPTKTSGPAASATGKPATSASASPGLNALNAKLNNLDTSGAVDYTPKRVKMTDPNELRDAAFAAHEAALAPPPEILEKTFGIFRQRRTLATPDYIEYVFEKTTFLGISTCKAYRITEMPFTEAAPDMRKGGDPGRHYSKPEIEIVSITPCSEKNYTPVTPGSLKTPVPRRDAFGPGPTAAPKPSLAPSR